MTLHPYKSFNAEADGASQRKMELAMCNELRGAL